MPNSEIDLGDDVALETETPLEEKYREQMRQIVSQKIELPISTLPVMIKEQINLSPEFQRRNRWDEERRSRFIESIIMNVPIPPVFLGEDEYGKYVVLDGRQRLTAVNEFFKNTYRLKKLAVWSELNGANFDELQKRKLAPAITRRFIPAIVVLKESSPVVKYDVFDRLNTGGMIANPMEIRNAIYQGPFTAQLQNLSRETVFRQLWDIPTDELEAEKNILYSQMFDVELILRFFAVFAPELINLRFKDYMSEFMDGRNKLYRTNPAQERQDAQLFNNAINNVWNIFGLAAFRKPDGKGALASNKSAPLADAEMVALAEIPRGKISPELAAKVRREFTQLAMEDEAFKKSITAGTNGKGAIATRIGKARQVVNSIF